MWADDDRPLISYWSRAEAEGVARLGGAIVVRQKVRVTVEQLSDWELVVPQEEAA